MSRCIAVDLTRLFLGPLTRTPRGIDRADLGFARHFFERSEGEALGILPMPWGIRWYSRERSVRLVDFVEQFWGERKELEADAAYAWLKEQLLTGASSIRLPTAHNGATQLLVAILQLIRQAGFTFGRSIRTLPKGAVYLNTGQIALAVPMFLTWLRSRPDVIPVFMLHDVIPVENPEFTAKFTRSGHRRMLQNTVRYAKGLIVTTEAAGTSIARELARLGSQAIPTITVAPPVPAPFLADCPKDAELGELPYFVICGAIEPRKNHLLLLRLWRQLVDRHGRSAPKLVIVGLRWRTSDEVIELLDNCRSIKGSVVEVAGLSTPGLRQLLADARALLMPSLAEGFGLPIVEALALGTPVIASDLPAHREAGGPYATYLAPDDESQWTAAIEALLSPQSFRAAKEHLLTYQPRTAVEYFAAIEHFIHSL